MAEKKIRVTQTRSKIGHIARQRRTLECLGLGRIGRSRVHTLTPTVQGMVKAVSHLVRIEQVEE